MNELIDFYEETGSPVPLDTMVEAVETYGFILDYNYPHEDDNE